MRVVIQKVSKASVSIDNSLKSSIGNGMLILLGVEVLDTAEDSNWLCEQIC